MLKRKYRLPGGIRFNSGRSIFAQAFLVKVKENGLLFNRFAIIVSKKIDKRAVVRNRIKRFISSCIAELYKDISLGYDMLFIVKSPSLGKTREEFCLSIKNIFKKEGFIK